MQKLIVLGGQPLKTSAASVPPLPGQYWPEQHGYYADSLTSYSDVYLAQLWHISQANPAEFGDRDACRLAQAVGFEITRRWLNAQPPELYAHQATHPQDKVLNKAYCATCNGSRLYRAPYSRDVGPCPDCTTLPISTASATTDASLNPTGSNA